MASYAALPLDLKLQVLSRLKLSIDARRALGLKPGKLRVPAWLAGQLIQARTVTHWRDTRGTMTLTISHVRLGRGHNRGGYAIYTMFYQDRLIGSIRSLETYDYEHLDPTGAYAYYNRWTGEREYASPGYVA